MNEVVLVPIPDGGPAGWVLLDRISDRPDPDQLEYCVHGQTRCLGCGAWCWLGSETHRAVVAGEVGPLCLPCGRRHIPDEAPRDGHLSDHRRAGGPH